MDILAKGRASERLGEREKWLENKQQKVLTTRTNRGGHNCDLGPVKSLKVNWEYRISDLRTAYKTLSWWGEGSTEPRAGLVTPHLKKDRSLFTLYLFKFRFVSEKWMEGHGRSNELLGMEGPMWWLRKARMGLKRFARDGDSFYSFIKQTLIRFLLSSSSLGAYILIGDAIKGKKG